MSLWLNIVDDMQRDAGGLFDNDFGFGIYPPQSTYRQPLRRREPIYSPLNYVLPPGSFFRELEDQRHREKVQQRGGGGGGALSQYGKEGFQVSMDVSQFKPSELNVKVVDNDIVVEGRHEERPDEHGYIARHFVRRYTLPQGYDPEKTQSTLSSDGVLTLSVPKPQAIESKSNERIIQIQQTGPAHLNIKDNKQEQDSLTDKTNDGGSKGDSGDVKKK